MHLPVVPVDGRVIYGAVSVAKKKKITAVFSILNPRSRGVIYPDASVESPAINLRGMTRRRILNIFVGTETFDFVSYGPLVV